MVESVPLLVAFSAGLLSFLSPCVLPLVPSYVTFVTGLSLDEEERRLTPPAVRRAAVLHSLAFIAGFSLVFVVVIGGLAGVLSDVLRDNKQTIEKIMGLLLIVFGLQMMGVLNISFLNYTKRVGDQVRPSSLRARSSATTSATACTSRRATRWTPRSTAIVATGISRKQDTSATTTATIPDSDRRRPAGRGIS